MSTFKNLVGHRINGIFVANDNWCLLFRTVEGRYFRYNTENDCCNSVWVNHINGVDVVGKGNSFDLLRGALVTGAEDKGWGESVSDEDGFDFIQDGFWTIRTDRGYIDIEVRNSHNGYYGGHLSEYDNEDVLAGVEDLKQVLEDF
jgi:hypothetical protein